MPKSSKETGKTKSLEDQKKELSSNLNKEVESKKDAYVKIHSLARQFVKIQMDVVCPVGSKSYQFKSDTIASLENSNYIFDENQSFNSFKENVVEILRVFPADKRHTVQSYLSKNQEYIPAEIKSLMLAAGKIDVSESKIEDVKSAIQIQYDHCYEIEARFIEMCMKSFSTPAKKKEIIDSYYPRINWMSTPQNLAELIYSLKLRGWIQDDSSVRHFASICHSHFDSIDKNGASASPETVRKAFDSKNKIIIESTTTLLKQLEKDMTFKPLELPSNM